MSRMHSSTWDAADSQRAEEHWRVYERTHDVAPLKGKTAGIDPISGQVWIGATVQDVVALRDADQVSQPLYFVRIGSPAYYRKGGRR